MDTHGRHSRFDGAEFVPGIRVFDCTAISNSQRLQKSAGTALACSSSYEEDARVPLKPWLSLGPNDPILATRSAEFILGSSVAVVPVSLSLMEAIRAIDPLEDLLPIKSELSEFTALLCADPRVSQRLLGGHANKVGLITTTFNPATSKYIGLHLDSFYDNLLEERHLAPNRLCLNVGNESRFLVFINLTLRQMHELILTTAEPNEVLSWSASSVGHVFMRRFPRYPVVRLAVRPGEAYIAPTENFIHDSTTEEKGEIDMAITLLGAFAPDSRI